MKKHLLVNLLTVVCSCFLYTQALVCFAADETGCLTCHKYPGLVRREKDALKALHIDEQTFLGSPHGKLNCKQCHADIVKVPHTGQNAVRCVTPACHASDKERAVIEKYPLQTLHQKEHSFIVKLQDQSSCRVCHALYPHSKSNLVRALLNMHTGFITCEVCHLKRDAFARVAYQWSEPEHVEFTGLPYGSRYDPERGIVRTTGNLISRLVVFVWEKGRKTLFVHKQDADEANRFLLEEKGLKDRDKETKLVFFHRNISRKEITLACKECHSRKGILDFGSLGFGKKKSKDLMDLDLAGLVAKYDVFYLPDLFGH